MLNRQKVSLNGTALIYDKSEYGIFTIRLRKRKVKFMTEEFITEDSFLQSIELQRMEELLTRLSQGGSDPFVTENINEIKEKNPLPFQLVREMMQDPNGPEKLIALLENAVFAAASGNLDNLDPILTYMLQSSIESVQNSV